MFLSNLSIKQPVLATMMAVALLTLGIFSYRELSIDQFPDVEIPVLTVQTLYTGASPETVEREVTKRIEEALNTISGVRHISSITTEGQSTVIVEFHLGTRIHNAQQDAQAKINAIRADFPEDMEEPVIQRIDFSALPVVSVAVESPTADIKMLSSLAEKILKKRLETLPGEQGQVDWGHFGRVQIGRAQRLLMAFVMVLSWSRMIFLRFFLDQRIANLMRGHQEAFAFFGGVPRVLLYDNPKTVMVQHDGQGQALRWNPVLADFLDYYGLVPKACPLYRARTKEKAESGVKHVKRDFLPERAFTGLADLNRALRNWVTTVADQRIHGSTDQRPLDRFREEAGQLIPLGHQPPYTLPKPVIYRVATHPRRAGRQ